MTSGLILIEVLAVKLGGLRMRIENMDWCKKIADPLIKLIEVTE